MKVIQGLSTSEYATLLTDKFLTEILSLMGVPWRQWYSYMHLTHIAL